MGEQPAESNQNQAKPAVPDTSIPAEPPKEAQITKAEETGHADEQAISDNSAHLRKEAEAMSGFWGNIRKTENTNLIMAIATVVIAVFTVLTFYLVLDSSGDTQKLITAAQTQANASSDQADAAQQFSDTAEDINGRMSDAVDQLQAAAGNTKASVGATQNASRLDQRAWMGMQGIDGLPELGKEFIVKITVINTGRSPAKHAQLRARYLPTKKGQKFVFDFGETKFVSNGLIPPGGIASTSVFAGVNNVPIPLVKGDIDQATSGEWIVHVIGRITYDDIFKRHHWTTFCAQLATDAKSWRSCPEYNETDDH